jgi:hypothetical protein
MTQIDVPTDVSGQVATVSDSNTCNMTLRSLAYFDFLGK